jgi:succinate dehydrogenase/fumarate reductase flavoprotein subunit
MRERSAVVADVVIAGYGPAGAAAAIAAHDAGHGVLVVEAAVRGGGNARYSGGFLFDMPDDAAVDHLDALCFGRTGRQVLTAYAAGLHELDGWLGSLGGTTAPFDPPPARLPAPFPSWPHLPAGHRIRYRTAAERLQLDPGGAVTGLAARRDGQAENFPAAGGVVLACGGFEADPGLADAYLPFGPAWPVGHPGNTGAGLVMAQQAGAALWHMYGCFGWFAFRTPEFAAPFAVDFFAASHVFTDADGRRFADETGYEVHDRLRALLTYLPRNPNRPRLPSWAVFDEAARQAGPLNGLLGTPNDYVWSADNAAEVERGWIASAGSPAALAAAMGVDPGVLTGTLEQYNACARAGRDELFGRSAETLVPLDLSRLYAIAAGAVSLTWGHLIEHGGGLTDALVFGRIAGVQAADRAAQVAVAPGARA